jgi:hypothetical protein
MTVGSCFETEKLPSNLIFSVKWQSTPFFSLRWLRLFIFISHDGYFIFSSSWLLTLWGPIGWTTAYSQSWPFLSLFARWDDRSWEPECPLSPALMELSLSTPLLVLGKISTPILALQAESSNMDSAEDRRSSFLSWNAVLPLSHLPLPEPCDEALFTCRDIFNAVLPGGVKLELLWIWQVRYIKIYNINHRMREP